MKRKPTIFALVLLAVSISYVIYVPLSLIMDIEDKRAAIILDRERRMIIFMQAAGALYRAGADEDLTALLREGMKQNEISYFVIYKNKGSSYYEPLKSDLASAHSFEERAPLAGKDVIDANRSERSEFLSGDTLLTLGIDKRHASYVTKTIFSNGVWKVIIQDVVFIIGLAALAFWLHTRDLTKLRKEIERTGRIAPDTKITSSHSAESEAIIAGLKGYESSENYFRERHNRLHNQVLPALKRELFSGQKPPYTFDCTLVRTDINGFSQIFNSTYRDRFAEHIDEFFIGLTEVASRYEGLIYEFVGDEAIFYFKDAETGAASSINRAVDCVRDIHELAREIDQKTKLEGHRFTVKSALAHGTLRFGQQVDGYSLSGGILIETVRILSTVTEKEDSNLYFAIRHSQHLRKDLRIESVGMFGLKGYSTEVELVRWVSGTSLSMHLSQAMIDGFDFVHQHRSDSHLLQIINTAAVSVEIWSLEHHLKLVDALRSTSAYRARQALAPSLTTWLEAAAKRASQDPTASKPISSTRPVQWWKLVSAIVNIYPNLVPKASLSERDKAQLESLLDSPDMRTVANTVEVLRRFDVAPVARPIAELFGNDNNRIAANAIIHAGSREISRDLLEKLDEMIFGKRTEEGRRASGLFAAGEIARLLKARDPVYYSTRVDFHRLLERIEPLCHNKNESIALHASLAIAKATKSSTLEMHAFEVRAFDTKKAA